MKKSFTKIAKKVWQDNCSGVPEFNMSSCCKKHDEDYTLTSKWRADWNLLLCGYKKAATYTWNRTEIGYKLFTYTIATIYFTGVSLFGWIHYFNAQKSRRK